jgi:hypothetical protein
VPLPDVVAMRTRQPNLEGAGEIPLRRVVKEALRMRPSVKFGGSVATSGLRHSRGLSGKRHSGPGHGTGVVGEDGAGCPRGTASR